MRRPSAGTVIASIALLVALGGTGVAAVALPSNSVGNAQLRRDAVTSSKVRDGSLLRRDFAYGQLPVGPAGSPGAVGVAGPPGGVGPQGASGLQGPAGVSGYEVVVTGSISVGAGAYASAKAFCPNGKRPLGGGVNTTGSGLVVVESDPITGDNSWFGAVKNTGGSSGSFRVVAVCAFVS